MNTPLFRSDLRTRTMLCFCQILKELPSDALHRCAAVSTHSRPQPSNRSAIRQHSPDDNARQAAKEGQRFKQAAPRYGKHVGKADTLAVPLRGRPLVVQKDSRRLFGRKGTCVSHNDLSDRQSSPDPRPHRMRRAPIPDQASCLLLHHLPPCFPAALTASGQGRQ